MKRSNSNYFMLAGVAELIIGLILSLVIGIQVSWTWALIMAATFFISANILFFLALKKA